jgi:hypothetical protein
MKQKLNPLFHKGVPTDANECEAHVLRSKQVRC